MVFDRGNGIYRCIFATLVGLTLVSAAPKQGSEKGGKNPNAQSDAGQSSKPVTGQSSDTVQIPQAPIHDRPCDQGNDNRQSDLCAQWKAADAASEAAWWAAFGSIVAMIGTAGLFWQIKLTREAVQDTGKATVAMEASNAIAAKSAAAFLAKERGRLCFYRQQISTMGDAKYLPFKIENTGNTECSLVKIHYIIVDHPVWSQPTSCADIRSVIPSKIEEVIEDVNSDILTGHDAGHILGFISYDGIAGMQYSAYFCYRFWRIGKSDVGFEWADCEGLPRDT